MEPQRLSPFSRLRDRLGALVGGGKGTVCLEVSPSEKTRRKSERMEDGELGGLHSEGKDGERTEDEMEDVGEERNDFGGGGTSGGEPHLWGGLRCGRSERELFASNRTTMTERDIHREFDLTKGGGGVVTRVKAEAKSRWRDFSWTQLLLSSFPIIGVLKSYSRHNLNADFFSGISAGVMAVPMGMSYAMLANLPPQFGLYVGLFYPFFYMLMGTGKHVVVGVSAIEDLLAGEAVSRIIGEKEFVSQLESQKRLLLDKGLARSALEDTLLQRIESHEALLTQARIDISIGLCVCVGIVYAIMRVLQAGLLADLLSVPVLSGFSTASAFLIGTSQLKHMTGLAVPADVENADFKIMRQWWYCFSNISEWNGMAVGICCLSIVLLAGCKFLSRRYFKSFPLPGPLIVVAVFTTVTYLCRLNEKFGVKVIGHIPDGFPSARLPSFYVPVLPASDLDGSAVTYRLAFLDVLREAFPLTVMFFIIHISIAKTITQQKKTYQIDPDQELCALAFCNFLGSLFQCFPCATSLSRTSVVSATGAQTQLHNISNMLVMILTLSLITPLLYFLPNAVLAAVVLFGVYGMMDFSEFFRLCKIGGLDVLLWLVCFFITVVFGAMEGILASIVLSLLWLLRKTARPQCIVLGRLPQTYIYRNIERFRMAKEEPGIKIVRFDASLNFSNSDYFDSRVRQKLEPSTRYLIIDGSSINDLDVTSIRMLQRLCSHLKQNGITMVFANWKGPMRDFLQRAQFYETLPPENCFLSLHDAVFWAKQKLAAQQKIYEVHALDRAGIPGLEREGECASSTAGNATAPLEPFYWHSKQATNAHLFPEGVAGEVEAGTGLSCVPTSECVVPSVEYSAKSSSPSSVMVVNEADDENSKRPSNARHTWEGEQLSVRKKVHVRSDAPSLIVPRSRTQEGTLGPFLEPNTVAGEGEGAPVTATTHRDVPGSSRHDACNAADFYRDATEVPTSSLSSPTSTAVREALSPRGRTRRRSLSELGPVRMRRLSSLASTAKATDVEGDAASNANSTNFLSVRANVRGSNANSRRAGPRVLDAQEVEWGWDGLSACNPGMIRMVTEVTGTGKSVSWAVLKTGQDSLHATVSGHLAVSPVPPSDVAEQAAHADRDA
ncbi:STAS domain-containing protein [Toxoplasma gondii VAND]|uniref:STAS domain-containing protein n=1 Tax=Toxoplasma gondii VAND TaxID=933077 RepID=A0A086QAW3_TOXGO|nr:STAS domain-containing protein [Toxoplasma gondii VAND]